MIIFIAMLMVVIAFTAMTIALAADEHYDRKEAKSMDLSYSIALAEMDILGH